MANFQKIQLTRSSVVGSVPLASELDEGELALNFADKKLFFKNSSGTVEDIVGISNVSAGIITTSSATEGNTTGLVGIGVSDPKEKLHVAGTVRIEGSVGQFNASGDDTARMLSRKEYIQFDRTDSNNTSSGSDGSRIYADATASATDIGDLVLGLSDNSSAGSQSFVIRNESSAASGGEGVGYTDIAYFGTDGSHQARVGVGTTTPIANLDVTSDSFTTVAIRGENTDATLQLVTHAESTPDNEDGWTIRNDYSESDTLAFRYDNIVRIKVLNTGRTGIGRTPTNFKLEVNDDILAIGSSPSVRIQDTDTADTHETVRLTSGGSNDAFEIQSQSSTYASSVNLYRIERDSSGATLHDFRIGASSTILSVSSTGIVVAGTSSATTLTDGTASINSGAITGATTATFSGNVTATTAPSTGDHLTNKTYVDSLVSTTAILNSVYPDGKRPAYYQDTTGKTSTNDRYFRRIQKISDPDSIVTLAEGGDATEHATKGTRLHFNANGKYQVKIGVTFDDNDTTSNDGYRLLVTRNSDVDQPFTHGLNGGELRSSDNASENHNAVMQEIIDITDHTSNDQIMLFFVVTYSSANVNSWSGQLNLEILKLT